MTERHYPLYPAPGRAATFQPARASMPSSLGYNPVYPGDIHYPAAGSHYAAADHDVSSPRYHYHTTAPVSRGPGTATYAITDDPLRRARDPEPAALLAPTTTTRTRRSSSTTDSTHPRPIIITTTQPSSRSHVHNPARDRSRSPTRPEYRPSSSNRSNSVSRQPAPARQMYSPTFETNDEEYMARLRGPDIIPASSRAEAYRNARPTVVYSSNPRHSTIDLGEDYGYTKPGELLQYDLEHPRQHHHHRRRDSFDHYARPNVYYNPERRGFSIETNRTHEPAPSLSKTENRGGPPPTTWGLDKLNRSSALYEPVPPPAPIPPPPLRDAPPGSPRERRGSNRHARPVSLYQEIPPRISHGDDYYRPREREESRHRREHREFDDPGRRHLDEEVFVDDNVRSRGFGIRTEPGPPLPEPDERRERRERDRREYVELHPPRRSDEDIDNDWDRIEKRELDDRHERKRSKQRLVAKEDDKDAPSDNKEDAEPGKNLRDSQKAGLGIAIGLSPTNKEGKEVDKKRRERRESPDRDKERAPRRESEEDDRWSSSDDEVEIISARTSDRRRPREKVYVPRERKERVDSPEPSPVQDSLPEVDSSPAAAAASDSSPRATRDSLQAEDDDADRSRQRERRSSFNPKDADDIRDVQQKLAAMNVSDKPDKVVVVEAPNDSPRRESRKDERSASSRREPSSQGHDLVVSNPEDKAVRVVSPPPTETGGTKPLKGILKPPSSKFPEDPNPIREGVAPHKNDEKLKEVPAGARWTRISRKIVNPEALAVGKERFEVRDDFVIVLRVLSKDEIQAYAAATAVLRERRRKEYEKSKGQDYSDDERDDDRRKHRRYRERDDYDEDEAGEGDRDRRHRRHRRYDEEEDEHRRRQEHRHHRRSYRERERDLAAP